MLVLKYRVPGLTLAGVDGGEDVVVLGSSESFGSLVGVKDESFATAKN